jgi:plastocyanin
MHRGGGRRRTLAIFAGATTGLVVLAGLTATDDGGGPAEAAPSNKTTVVLKAGAYHPARVRIRPGSRVTFVNRSRSMNTAETHGVGFFEYDRKSLDARNEFDIHTLVQGEAESVEFDTPGVYRYRSSLDTEMKGRVEVVGR